MFSRKRKPWIDRAFMHRLLCEKAMEAGKETARTEHGGTGPADEKNGKEVCSGMEQVMYQESYGPVFYTEGFEELLEGRTVEEQKALFRIGCGLYRNRPLKERKKEEDTYSCPLEESPYVRELIVKDGNIVGVTVRDVHGKTVHCLAERGFMTYDEEELDGSGYKSVTRYQYLICVPEDFDTP